MNHVMRSISMFLATFILLSGVANAQWVFVGRKALGKIKQITGEATEGASSQPADASKNVPQQGYDAATVILEAPADKVYSTTVRVLQANKESGSAGRMTGPSASNSSTAAWPPGCR